MSEDSNSSNKKTADTDEGFSPIVGGENIISMIKGNDPKNTVQKLKLFAERFGKYSPEVGDLVRAIPNAYTTEKTKNTCIVVKVYDPKPGWPDYREGLNPSFGRMVNMDVAVHDRDDDTIVTYATCSDFFELIKNDV